MSELLITSRPCDQCLTSRNRIVPGARAAEIIKNCRTADVHFQCHKGSVAGMNVHCRGVHEAVGPCLACRMATAFGMPVVEIGPETLDGAQ